MIKIFYKLLIVYLWFAAYLDLMEDIICYLAGIGTLSFVGDYVAFGG